MASYYLAALNTITLPLCKLFPIALGADDRVIFAPELNPFSTGNFGSLPLFNRPHDADLPMAQTRLDRFLEKRGPTDGDGAYFRLFRRNKCQA